MTERLTGVRQGYDRWAVSYDDADASTVLDEPAVRELAGPLAGQRALDVACGTGRFARLLAEAGAKVVGVDLSIAMLRRAMRDGPPASWVQGSVERLPIADAAVAGVTCGLVIDHLPEPGVIFGEIARVLRPGGVMLLSAVHPELQQFRGERVRFETERERLAMPGHIHQPGKVRAAIEGAGLAVTRVAEPRVDESLVERDPAWRPRLGLRALLVIEAQKPA